MSGHRRAQEGGFILALSILLVVLLTVSGTSFMQHDYLERRMAMNNVDNHGAFYLANAGIERSRATFKVPNASFTWTAALNDPARSDPAPLCLSASDPNSCLCPPDLSKGCIIPPFQMPTGDLVTSGMPFDAMFGGAPYSYTARAFNDDAPGETGSLDLNGILFFRAIGIIRGEQKLIEIKAKAISTLGLINCVKTTGQETCPGIKGKGISVDDITNPDRIRDPAFQDQLLPLDPPLSDPSNFYRDVNQLNTYYSNVDPVAHPTGLATGTWSGTAEDWNYYFVNSDVALKNSASNMVLFSTGNITVSGGPVLNNVTLVAQGNITTHGNVTLSSLLPLPAIIAGGEVNFGSGSVMITGNLYAGTTISLNPITVNGLLISDDVQLQGNSTLITDQGNLDYYAFMPGFNYSEDEKGIQTLPGGWHEIQ